MREGCKVPKAGGRVEWKVKVREGTKDGRLEGEDGRGKGRNEDDTGKNGRF